MSGTKTEGTRVTAGGTQAVDRAAMLVTTVVEADQALSFAELAEECELPKSTASRLLTALERTELIERTASGSYVAGPLFWLYATRHDPWEEMVRLAHPVLERIGEETRETVNLGVARGDRVMQVAQVDSTYILGARDWTQVDVPGHCSALGKVLYAYDVLPLPEGDLHKRTEHTVATREALRRQLASARAAGYATAIDELEPGLTAVAAPVRGSLGTVIAALGVSGPTARLEPRLDQTGRLLKDQAERLSSLLRRKTRKEGAA